MAQVTGGGGKAAVMPDFDPKGTTLRDTIIGYAKASRAEGNKLVGFEDKLFRNKALQTYLDNPVVELFDGHWGDEDNPLVKLLSSVGEGSRGQLYSAFISLEENVFRQISRLRFNEEYKKLTDGVARPAKGGKYTSKFLYNPERIGDFHKGLVEFVKNNPDSKPVANALLFQLYTGFRPNAAGGITPRDIYPPESRANIHSLFIGANRVGAKGSPINVPLTRRAMAILNSQKIYNDNKFKGEKFIFQKKVKGKLEPIDDTDITGLLKKLQKANLIPPRLKVDASGDVVKGTTNLTAYDLRRIHATTLSNLGVSLEKAALLTGRVVGGGAEQARYVGSAPGSANPEGAAKNANQLTDFMYQEYSRTVPGGMNAAEKENKFLSRDRDIFSPNQPVEFVKPDTDVYKGPTYKPSSSVISTADPDFIEGEYKVIDQEKSLTKIEDASDETKKWFQAAGGTLKDEAPKIEDKTSGASKLIKGVGKKIIPSLTIAAIAQQYAKSKKAGASTLEAGIRAGTELLPLSMQDVEDLGGFAKEAREKGIPEALDLDTERQQRMNVLRKQRLADRVQRNTSVTPPEDQGFINQNQIGR